MSGFCGWIGHASAPGDAATLLARMVAALPSGPGEARVRCLTQPGAGLGGTSAPEPADVVQDGPYLAAVAGRPRFEDAALAGLAAERGPAAALLEGWRRGGRAVLEGLRGPFAIAVLHPAANEALLAIDWIGGRCPLVYKASSEGLVFGSTGHPVQVHPRGAAEPDPADLFDFVYFRIIPSPATGRRDVQRLLPGEYLHFRDGSVRCGRHRAPEFVEDGRADLAALEREFLDVLKLGVRRAAAGARVGCFLSGGTDSSAIAGLAGEATGEPARTYSIGFRAEGYDEMDYARTAAERFRTEHHEYYLTPEDVVDFIPRLARAYAQPMGNESAIAAYHCARIAREDGVERMLGGDGGDELFAGNTRYAKQRVFELWNAVPGPLRAGLRPLILGFPGGDAIPPLRKVRSYVRQASMPLPDRLESYNALLLLGLERAFTPEFLAQIDTGRPVERLRETWNAVQAHTTLNRMLGLDFKLTLADNDLPKVSRMCAIAGVGVAYPLLCDELVELSCRVPERYKLRGFKLRWFWKHALRDLLPEKILNKPKHGMGVPFGVWLREHGPLGEIVLDSLNGLRGRGIVRPEFIDELLRLHREVHATYYGSMLWVLVQLEQWFRAHVDAATAAHSAGRS